MIQKPVAVEYHFADPFFNGAPPDELADKNGLVDLVFKGTAISDVLFGAGGSDHRMSPNIIYNLGIDMRCAPKHAQSRTLRSPGQMLADPLLSF